MAELNIPHLSNKSDKYIFKKKLRLRRKSSKRLFIESAFMFILSFLLFYLNYLIPNKNLLLQNTPTTLKKFFILFIDLFSMLPELFLVVFIIISYILVIIFLAGSFYRIVRIKRRKTRIINYK